MNVTLVNGYWIKKNKYVMITFLTLDHVIHQAETIQKWFPGLIASNHY